LQRLPTEKTTSIARLPFTKDENLRDANNDMEASTAIRDPVLNPTAVYTQIASWDRILGDSSAIPSDNLSWDDSVCEKINLINWLIHEYSWIAWIEFD
jgi:hypothetical protein